MSIDVHAHFWPDAYLDKVAARRVVPVALAEGQQERLGHDVVRRVAAEAADHVTLDVRCVAAEQHGEALGLIPGEPDDGRVVRVRVWISVCPALWCHP